MPRPALSNPNMSKPSDATFERTRETSNLLRTAGMMVTAFLSDGQRIHGEVGTPFPQGLRDGTLTLWLFGVGKQVRFGRREISFARVYRDSSTAGKRHGSVSFQDATDDNRAFLESRKVAA